MEDYYGAIGTTGYAAEHDVMNNNRRGTILAYQKISTESLRNQINHTEQVNCKKQVSQKKTAYETLNVLETKLEKLSEEEKDKYLEEREKELLDFYAKDLKKEKNFNKRLKIELAMKEVKEAYEQVKTVEERRIYADQKQKEEEEEKYSHTEEFNPALINGVLNSDYESIPFQAKKVEREEKLEEEHSYTDKENRQLRIKQTAKIKFQNWTGVGELFINEYEIKRVIDCQEKVDIVYTLPSKDLNEMDEMMDKDSDYYDCFINKLLAEETIAGSKYNEGFIGGIEQDQEGNYYITLEKDSLSPMEQEQMTAVIIMKQRERSIKEQEERGENII